MARRSQKKSPNKSYSNKKDGDKVTDQKTSTSGSSGNNAEPTNKTGDSNVPDKPTQNNDPAWYARDPALLRDAATLFFSYAFGKDYYINGSAKHMPNGNQYVGKVKTPGILALRMKPTLGFSMGATSPLNVSAASIYAYVRHLNSGRKNYDPSDLFLYLAAIANLYSAIVWAERLYQYAFSYSNANRYIGDALLRTEGLDPVDFRYNLANYRMKLNEFINKVSVFAVPSDITLFNKCAFMYKNIYLENGDGNIRDQMYMYIPDGFYKFTLDSDNLGCLDYTRWNHDILNIQAGQEQVAKWTDVMNFLDSLMTGLFMDEDASLISGDLFKVYGDRIIRLTSLDELGVLPLVYDPYVLWQIKNSRRVDLMRKSLATTPSTSSGSITKTGHSTYSLGSGRTQVGYPGCVFQTNDGYLTSVERHTDTSSSSATAYENSIIGQYAIAVNKILTSELSSPDAGVVMESTRNVIGPHDAPTTYAGTESNKDLGWIECGSFVCVGIAVNTQGADSIFFETVSGVYQISSNRVSTSVKDLMMFRYAPLQFFFTLDSNGDVDDYYPISDIQNYCILDASSVTKLHEAALLSLLYVPGIARIG